MLRFILLLYTDFCFWQIPDFSPTSPSYLSKSKFFSLLFFCVCLHQNQFLEGKTTSVGSNRGINRDRVRMASVNSPPWKVKDSNWQCFPGCISSSSRDGEDIFYWYKIWECLLGWPSLVLPPHAEHVEVTRVCVLFSAATQSSQGCAQMGQCAEDVQETLPWHVPAAQALTPLQEILLLSVHIPFPFSLHIGFIAQIHCWNPAG